MYMYRLIILSDKCRLPLPAFGKYLEQRLLFRQTTGCEIPRIIAGYCRFRTAFHHKTALIVHACEKLLCQYQVVVEAEG